MTTMTIAPEIWRQLLAELTNNLIAELFHLGKDTIRAQRQQLDIEYPWPEPERHFQAAAATIARERWGDYPKYIPEPIAPADLEALIKARMANRKPGVKPAPEPKPTHLAPETIISTIQSLEAAGAPPPTDEDLGRILERNPRLVYNILFHQRHLVIRDADNGTYRLRPPLLNNGTRSLSPAEAAQSGPAPMPKADADEMRDIARSRVESMGSTANVVSQDNERLDIQKQMARREAEAAPEQEVKDVGRDRIPWPPDEQFWREVCELRDAKKSPEATLAKRYGCSSGSYWTHHGDVREALGMSRKATCKTCQDTGYVNGGLSGPVCSRCDRGKSLALELAQAAQEVTGGVSPCLDPQSEIKPPEEAPEVTTQQQTDAAEAGEAVIQDATAVYATIAIQFPNPCLMLLDNEVRLVELEDGQYLPEIGDEWPETYTMGNRRRVRKWHCVKTATHQRSGAEIRIMVQAPGVALMPEEVA